MWEPKGEPQVILNLLPDSEMLVSGLRLSLLTQQVGGPSLLLEVHVTGETLVSPSVGANPLLLQVKVNVYKVQKAS